MTTFHNSDNKRVLRRVWNSPLIKARKKALGRGLSYLGMPGPEIEDLLDWRDYLGRIRTGVEFNRTEEAKSNQQRIIHNVMKKGAEFSSGFELRKCDVEELIIRGVDDYDVKPQLGDGFVDGHFSYDLINLDFCGGLGYKDKFGHTKRVKALRRLAERQQDTNFILLLTLNVRDHMGGEVVEYLHDAQKHYHKDDGFCSTLAWYASRGEGEQAYVLKAAVPMFIQQAFEVFGFRVFSYPPVLYEGTAKGKLVNFMFDARHKAGSNLPVFSEQSAEEIVRLPLMEVSEGKVQVAATQHPEFDFSTCNKALVFLDPEVRKKLVNECRVRRN